MNEDILRHALERHNADFTDEIEETLVQRPDFIMRQAIWHAPFQLGKDIGIPAGIASQAGGEIFLQLGGVVEHMGGQDLSHNFQFGPNREKSPYIAAPPQAITGSLDGAPATSRTRRGTR
ncbi:MAG: hypothetical protein AB1713_04425 [Pseudomonadota bacterium]